MCKSLKCELHDFCVTNLQDKIKDVKKEVARIENYKEINLNRLVERINELECKLDAIESEYREIEKNQILLSKSLDALNEKLGEFNCTTKNLVQKMVQQEEKANIQDVQIENLKEMSGLAYFLVSLMNEKSGRLFLLVLFTLLVLLVFGIGISFEDLKSVVTYIIK